MAGAFGVQSKFGIGATSTVDKPLDLLSDTVRLTSEIIDGNPQGLKCSGKGDVDSTATIHQYLLNPAFPDYMVDE